MWLKQYSCLEDVQLPLPWLIQEWHMGVRTCSMFKRSVWVYLDCCKVGILSVNHFMCNSGKWPTWRTISSLICLFESSKCFEQLCAHPQEDSCINTIVLLRMSTELLENTRSCINTIVLLRMSTELLENTRSCINTIVLLRMSTELLENTRSCINTIVLLRMSTELLENTRSCINTIVLLRMSTEVLERCRGFK